jgi:hypothetical protein
VWATVGSPLGAWRRLENDIEAWRAQVVFENEWCHLPTIDGSRRRFFSQFPVLTIDAAHDDISSAKDADTWSDYVDENSIAERQDFQAITAHKYEQPNDCYCSVSQICGDDAELARNLSEIVGMCWWLIMSDCLSVECTVPLRNKTVSFLKICTSDDNKHEKSRCKKRSLAPKRQLCGQNLQCGEWDLQTLLA